MRRLDEIDPWNEGQFKLQFGRIVEDAETGHGPSPLAAHVPLQFGRIVEDAETYPRRSVEFWVRRTSIRPHR